MQINPVESTGHVYKTLMSDGKYLICGGDRSIASITDKQDTLSDKGGLNVVKPTGKILIKQGYISGSDNIRGTELLYDLSAVPFSPSDWSFYVDINIVSGEPDLAPVKRVILFLTEDMELSTGNFVCVYQKADNKLYIIASDGTNSLAETVLYDTALSDDTDYSIQIGYNGIQFSITVDGHSGEYVNKPAGYDPTGLKYYGWGFIPVLDANTLLQIAFSYGNQIDLTGNYTIEWVRSNLDANCKPGLIGAGLLNSGTFKIPGLSETGYSIIALIKPGTANESYLKIGNDVFSVAGAEVDKWVCDIQTGAGALSGEVQIFGNAGNGDNPTTSTENPTTSTEVPSVIFDGEMCLLVIRKNEISAAVQAQIIHALYAAAGNIEIDRVIIR